MIHILVTFFDSFRVCIRLKDLRKDKLEGIEKKGSNE